MGSYDYQSELLHLSFMGDLTTLRNLQYRLRYTNQQAADFVGVSKETYRRWRTDRKPNVAAVKLLSVMAGKVPWVAWENWEVHNGFLFAPQYSKGLSPGQIMAMHYDLQQLAYLKMRVRQFESLHDQTESANDFPDQIHSIGGRHDD